ncbi:hypothetical protein PFISCL1PPCAC_29037, partial [Pristionchus fissidentatus]
NIPKFTEESARFANTLMRSTNFKFKLIKIQWYTRGAETEEKDLEFFRSFPSSNSLSLNWNNYMLFQISSIRPPK